MFADETRKRCFPCGSKQGESYHASDTRARGRDDGQKTRNAYWGLRAGCLIARLGGTGRTRVLGFTASESVEVSFWVCSQPRAAQGGIYRIYVLPQSTAIGEGGPGDGHSPFLAS